MQWYKDACNIFEAENETYMCYWRGQEINNLPHIRDATPVVEGMALQVLLFIYRLIKNCRPFGGNTKAGRVDYFYYANTKNQIVSLQSSLAAQKRKGAKVCSIAERSIVENNEITEHYEKLSYSLADIGKALVLLVVRGPGLWKKLRDEYDITIRTKFYADFCRPYIYVPYFLRTLERRSPKFVVVANDHNVMNRSLIAVAHFMKIKTVYMQHASIGQLFPALRFNYAFLDGSASLDIYKKCRGNIKPTQSHYPQPTVFLSGQKKQIEKVPPDRAANYIGLAINILNDMEDTVRLVDVMLRAGFKLCIRWHPAQDSASVLELKKAVDCRDSVVLSDPDSSTLQDFFSLCYVVVAGNTSIHLEAIVAGVPAVYYEITPAHVPDAYGYVASGLTDRVDSVSALLNYVKVVDAPEFYAGRAAAIRYYSSSFGTAWEGREGVLVAETLQRISHVQTMDDLYVEQDEEAEFERVYALA